MPFQIFAEDASMNIKAAVRGLTAAVALSCTTAAITPAYAGISGFTRNSQVTDSVVDNGNGTWTYRYTVFNTSTFGGQDQTEPVIVDWELPWFGDAGIDTNSILSPHNWTWSIETIGAPNSATGWGGVASWQDPNDPFYAGAGSPFTGVTQVLHWYNECWVRPQETATLSIQAFAVASCEGQFDNAIFMSVEGFGGSLDGFEFTADYDPTAAPYQASWANLPVRSGDPAFPLGGIPASPLAIGITAVPVPGVLLLLGGGLLAFGATRRFRRY